MNELDSPYVEELIALALAEDVGEGDVTTTSTVPLEAQSRARIIAREAGTLAGMPVAERVFRSVDPCIRVECILNDGADLASESVVAQITGSSRGILTGERVALNFLQHLSGIATLTATFVKQVEGTNARILDTRKTIPGMRALAKYAVRTGGGQNHRFGLFDGVLIKDNHLLAAGGVAEAVSRARAVAPEGMRVEVEVETLTQVEQALEAGADILLLDNMPLDLLRQSVSLCRSRALTEASGGVTMETVRPIAETGVDYISIGALTHSAPALDLSMDFLDAAGIGGGE